MALAEGCHEQKFRVPACIVAAEGRVGGALDHRATRAGGRVVAVVGPVVRRSRASVAVPCG